MVIPEWLAALVPLTGLELVVDARGDRQLPADRLDPILTAVLINERGHHFRGRSSSAWAKNAAALRRISLACLSSLFSRSNCLRRSRSEIGRASCREGRRSGGGSGRAERG